MRRAGFTSEVATIEVGLRELHDRTAQLVREVEAGAHLLVTRHGRPVAVVVPLQAAAAWVLDNRPLPPSWDTDEESWQVDELVLIAPAAEEGFDVLPDQVRTRLVRRLGRLRRQVAVGHVVVREGQVWALAAFSAGAERATLLAVGRRVELEQWLTRARG